MWKFNILATMAQQGRYGQLLHELSELGEFHKTTFHGVILGQVEEVEPFLEAIRKRRQERLIAFQDLGRIVPLETVFTFELDDFLPQLCQVIRPHLEQLVDRRFHVRLERRGLKGEIVSPDVEQALDAFILDELADMGHSAQVNFEDSDVVVAIETIGDRCGVGWITKNLTERYEFVRVD
ncbi:MAG: THUMP domain-containing protein [Syntrophotaleaceae bacterium]